MGWKIAKHHCKAIIDKPYGILLGVQLSDDAHIDRAIDFLYCCFDPTLPIALGELGTCNIHPARAAFISLLLGLEYLRGTESDPS